MEQEIQDWIFFRRKPLTKVIPLNGQARTKTGNIIAEKVIVKMVHIKKLRAHLIAGSKKIMVRLGI